MINRIWLFLVFINVAATTRTHISHTHTHTNTICILSRLIFAMANLRRQCERFGNNKIHVECGKEIVHQRGVCVNKQHDRVWRASQRVDKTNWSQHTCKMHACVGSKVEGEPRRAPQHSRIHRVHFLFYSVRLFFPSFSDIRIWRSAARTSLFVCIQFNFFQFGLRGRSYCRLWVVC